MLFRYGSVHRGAQGFSGQCLRTLDRMNRHFREDARNAVLVPRVHQKGMTPDELRQDQAAHNFTVNTGLSILDYPGGIEMFLKDLERGAVVE